MNLASTSTDKFQVYNGSIFSTGADIIAIPVFENGQVTTPLGWSLASRYPEAAAAHQRLAAAKSFGEGKMSIKDNMTDSSKAYIWLIPMQEITNLLQIRDSLAGLRRYTDEMVTTRHDLMIAFPPELTSIQIVDEMIYCTFEDCLERVLVPC